MGVETLLYCGSGNSRSLQYWDSLRCKDNATMVGFKFYFPLLYDPRHLIYLLCQPRDKFPHQQLLTTSE